MRVYNKSAYDSASIAITSNGPAMGLESIYGFAIQAVWTVLSPSAAVLASATDINATSDTFTKVTHGFYTGLKVALTTDDTLPTGLSATDYYVIRATADTFQIATSAANASAGTAVNFTTVGVGNQTFTPAALAGAVVKLQATNDDANDSRITPTWTDLAAPQTITTSGSYMWDIPDSFYSFVRLTTTMTAGELTMAARLNGKGV